MTKKQKTYKNSFWVWLRRVSKYIIEIIKHPLTRCIVQEVLGVFVICIGLSLWTVCWLLTIPFVIVGVLMIFHTFWYLEYRLPEDC
jgi:hypothetical protein